MKKREVKAIKKAVALNPEKKRPDALFDDKKIKVKKPRKPTGEFQALPVEELMHPSGLGALWGY